MISVEKVVQTEYPKFFNYPNIVTKPALSFFKNILHENKINDFLKENPEKGLGFIDNVLNHLNISYKSDNRALENVPAMGKVIIVANHPLGALDAIVLIKMVSSLRSDKKVKIVANSVLSQVKPLAELIIPVDNMNSKLSKESYKAVMQALENEEVVIFFPAGEVSRANLYGIRDGKWKNGFVKYAKRSNTPVLPIFIKAKNSALFYTSSFLYKPFGTMLLSNEMVNAQNKVVEFIIGEQVSAQAISNMNFSYKQHAKLFRKHLYRLASGKKLIYPTEQCIAHPESRQLIKQELKACERIGTTSDNKHIYLVEADASPTILAEIGRLREYSFRKVGEGSGKHRDVDRYDEYYQQLVLFDDEALEIVGAYRIGEANWILSWLGKEGLYLNSLCKFDESFDNVLMNAIELGRSFVQPKYWGTRALDYLWQGIGAYLSCNPHIKYMIGAVSISNTVPKNAQDALVYFYSHYFNNTNHIVSARSPYTLSSKVKQEFDEMFDGNNYEEDIKYLKEYLRVFNVTIPTLYKQYGDLCDKGGVSFLDFGVDSDFNDCIDGYLLVKTSMIKESKKKRYINN